jgi:hypothetical protein
MPRDIYFLDLAVCAATENTVLALFIHGTLTQATELVIHGNKKNSREKFFGAVLILIIHGIRITHTRSGSDQI